MVTRLASGDRDRACARTGAAARRWRSATLWRPRQPSYPRTREGRLHRSPGPRDTRCCRLSASGGASPSPPHCTPARTAVAIRAGDPARRQAARLDIHGQWLVGSARRRPELSHRGERRRSEEMSHRGEGRRSVTLGVEEAAQGRTGEGSART
jgi:hypothetical protein